jgi:hypothetical protein
MPGRPPALVLPASPAWPGGSVRSVTSPGASPNAAAAAAAALAATQRTRENAPPHELAWALRAQYDFGAAELLGSGSYGQARALRARATCARKYLRCARDRSARSSPAHPSVRAYQVYKARDWLTGERVAVKLLGQDTPATVSARRGCRFSCGAHARAHTYACRLPRAPPAGGRPRGMSRHG